MKDGLNIPEFKPIPVHKEIQQEKSTRWVKAWDQAAPWIMVAVSLMVFWAACFGG